MTRYARVRLLASALLAVLVVGGTTASAHASDRGVGVGTFLLSLLLGLVCFGVLAVLLLFDSRRRHQLVRALRSFVSSDRRFARYRRAEDKPCDEQRAEMRRRLDYALEGLRRAVASEPVAVGATSGRVLPEDGRRLAPVAREVRPYVSTRMPEAAAVLEPSTGPARGQARLPVSSRVAQGAPLVRLSVARYRQSLGVAAAQTRLTDLRVDDDRSTRREAVARWLVRVVVLLFVPAMLTYQVLAGSSWLAGVWDGVTRRDALLVALALSAAGSAWTVVVTRPERGSRTGPRTTSESHAVRSLLATEQLALRLAVGVAPSDAWQTVTLTNHFPPQSAIPAVAVDEALALVEQLRHGARRRHSSPVRARLGAILRPLLSCLLPASVIIFLL